MRRITPSTFNHSPSSAFSPPAPGDVTAAQGAGMTTAPAASAAPAAAVAASAGLPAPASRDHVDTRDAGRRQLESLATAVLSGRFESSPAAAVQRTRQPMGPPANRPPKRLREAEENAGAGPASGPGAKAAPRATSRATSSARPRAKPKLKSASAAPLDMPVPITAAPAGPAAAVAGPGALPDQELAARLEMLIWRQATVPPQQASAAFARTLDAVRAVSAERRGSLLATLVHLVPNLPADNRFQSKALEKIRLAWQDLDPASRPAMASALTDAAFRLSDRGMVGHCLGTLILDLPDQAQRVAECAEQNLAALMFQVGRTLGDSQRTQENIDGVRVLMDGALVLRSLRGGHTISESGALQLAHAAVHQGLPCARGMVAAVTAHRSPEQKAKVIAFLSKPLRASAALAPHESPAP